MFKNPFIYASKYLWRISETIGRACVLMMIHLVTEDWYPLCFAFIFLFTFFLCTFVAWNL